MPNKPRKNKNKDKYEDKTEDEMATFICKRGYGIVKECLEKTDLDLIRKELTVKPYVPKTSLAKPESFFIFRESSKNIYVPKFYGVENFGDPEGIKIGDGDDIDLTFNGSLRDIQMPVVDKFLKSAKTVGGGLLELHTGFGKTCCALNIISQLKKKTIIIVHKEFLLRQWIERIEQFLPDAKVGKIQAKTVDIEGKDIVIGMLQSLSMKEYDLKLFRSFGLTIIDECHHISAEVFSRSLLKIVTKYTLGLSATMKRKDGLTHVIKKFLGDIVYTKHREGKDKVLVKAIEYYNSDEDYSRTELNWKKQVHYSKMIKKICEFNRRSEFILDVLKHTLENGDEDMQVMILGHNRNLLTYLHDAIEYRKMASVGYYVGGMKEADLKASESKKIVIATYAMAEEGLDIKSLNTLIMATPKVDVTQAVGRILRKKESEALVIDIVDQHALFERHWTKRRAFYRKQNFEIKKTHMLGYLKDDWTDESKRGGRKKAKSKKARANTNTNTNTNIHKPKSEILLDLSDMFE